MRWCYVWLGIVAVGCGSRGPAATGSHTPAAASQSPAKHVLAYNTEALAGRYRFGGRTVVSVDGATKADGTMQVDMRFARSASDPTRIDAYLERLEVHEPPEPAQVLSTSYPQHADRLRPAVFRVAVGPNRLGEVMPNPDSVMAEPAGKLGIFMLALFPVLPDGDVGVGATWVAKRTVTVGADINIEADVGHRLDDVGTCDGRAKQSGEGVRDDRAMCAYISIDADTGPRPYIRGGAASTYSARVSGSAVVRLDGGLERASWTVDSELTSQGMSATARWNWSVEPMFSELVESGKNRPLP